MPYISITKGGSLKRIVSFILFLLFVVLSCVVPFEAAEVSVSDTSANYNTPFVSGLSIGRNYNNCPSWLNVDFRSVSGVSYYRLYCKITSMDGSVIKDWKRMKDMYDGGKWDVNTSIYLNDSWLSSINTLGAYDVAAGGILGESCYDIPLVRVWVTVRGISSQGGDTVTGYLSGMHINIYEDDFCPIIKSLYKSPSGRVTAMINTALPLSISSIRYYRIYCKRNGSWSQVNTINIRNIYRDREEGRQANCDFTKSQIQSCDKNRDGTVTLAVRGLNQNGDFCTPFIKQYVWKSSVI